MSTTKYIVNNLSGQTITNEPILRPYKVYTALLTQSGNGTSTQTTGPLIIGTRYIITTYVSDDDFTSVANVISGTINTDGCEFIAIGTTPDNYINGSTLTDTGAPVATVLENTIGDIQFIYGGTGTYVVTSFSLFTLNKTNIFLGQVADNSDTANPGFSSIVLQDSSNILIRTYDSSRSISNDGLIITPIEIRVYN